MSGGPETTGTTMGAGSFGSGRVSVSGKSPQLDDPRGITAQLLDPEWRLIGPTYPKDRCLHQLIEEQVERTPDAVAVLFEDERLSFDALNRRANRLAHHLRTLGVGPEVPVALFLERSTELAVAVLALRKSGAANVPRDPDFPADRLAFMLQDTRARFIVTESRFRHRLPPHDAAAILLDQDAAAIATRRDDNPDSGVVIDNLCSYFYTSGSTGTPKGVQVRHSAVVNLLESLQEEIHLEAGDVYFPVTSLSFDISALELFLPLTVGACVALAPREVVNDGVRLAAALTDSAATAMQATPATWRLLLDSGWSPPAGLKILCGGEALPRALADRLLTGGGPVWNLYGPTETTIWSTVERVGPGSGTVPIGRPLANTRVYIIDHQFRPVPIGVAGELLIGGDGLARGHLDGARLTAEAFVPDPFGNEPGARLYRTGDQARYQPDGRVEYLGRLDRQAKLRGVRIEPAEIEAVLTRHSAVREAAVAILEDQTGELSLTAFLVLDPDQAAATEDLRVFARQSLPASMVPSRFVGLERLPLTPNRKVDYQALTVDGGERLRSRRPWQVPLNIVFQAPTVRAMAQLLGASTNPGGARNSAANEAVPPKQPLYCLNMGPTLASLLDDRPVYPLELSREEEVENRTIEEYASCLKGKLIKVQGQGPYLLAGYSAMGIVAFEMAQQLCAEGQKVSLVVLFEPSSPTGASFLTGNGRQSRKPGRTVRAAAELAAQGNFREMVRRTIGQLRRIGKLARRKTTTIPILRDFIDIELWLRIIQCSRSYVPRTYHGNVLVYASATGTFKYSYDRILKEWGRLAGNGLTFCEIPGDHWTMFETRNIGVIAEELQQHLARADHEDRSVDDADSPGS